MNKEVLFEDLGLTKPEREAYIGLLELGETKTGELCTHTSIQSSKIYMILESLIQKGLVSYTTINNIKHYSATPVETLDVLFEKKKQELDQKHDQLLQLIQELKEIPQKTSDASKYKYFEGISGIKSLYLQLLSHMDEKPKSTLRIYSANTQMTKRLLGFFEEFHLKRVAKNVPYKLIVPKDLEKSVQKRKEQNAQLRSKEITTSVSWGVIGDIFFLNYNGSKQPYGIIITDALTARTFDVIFEELW